MSALLGRRVAAMCLVALLAACGGGTGLAPEASEPASAQRGAVALAESDWVLCASEGASCTFSGTRQVRYGTTALNVVKSYTGSVACNNSVFGDPAYNQVKKCWYSATAATPSAAAAPAAVSPDAWKLCANEGEACVFSGTRQVRYGTTTQNVTKSYTDVATCSNVSFGDPAPGVRKQCWYATGTNSGTATTPAATPPAPTTTSATSWTQCAREGGSCSFSGQKRVRYGADPKFAEKTLTGPVACGNAVFGDPAYGTAKSCWYADAASAATTPTQTPTSPPAGGTSGAAASVNVGSCVPGVGRDIQVGPGSGQTASLDLVAWESLGAGDTVRIFYRAEPYRGKILIQAQGTASAPVRVCGVKGPNGERPIIDGAGAVARRGLSYTAPQLANIQETRSVILIDRLATQDWWTAVPSYVTIDGLEVRGARPGNSFVNSQGGTQQYVDFGACIWIDRGHNITLADNVIHDCTQGVFSRSTDDGAFMVTKNLRLTGNDIYGNGVAGSDRQHNVYIQSAGAVYEFNRFGALRSGAGGNAIKDRSSGTVVRFNRIEGGAHSIDLVEAEDWVATALADPAYRTAFVYGNQIVKDGGTGSAIHYGGDHYGCCEANFRRGTLYFWSNTVYLTGSEGRMFQVSTTLERAEAWNNVLAFAPSMQYPSLRQNTEIGAGYTAGGVVNLGVNWTNTATADSDPYHPIPGTLAGVTNLRRGSTLPFDTTTLQPLAGGALVDAASTPASLAAATAAHPLAYQLNAAGQRVARAVNGAASDLGAIER